MYTVGVSWYRKYYHHKFVEYYSGIHLYTLISRGFNVNTNTLCYTCTSKLNPVPFLCLIFPIQFFPFRLLLRHWALLYLRALDGLRKAPTFRNATTGVSVKWRLRNEWRSSILMTCHNPDLGSDTSSVWNFCAWLFSQAKLWRTCPDSSQVHQ